MNTAYKGFNSGGLDNVNPNIVKYFRTEYGANWKSELEHHLYKERNKNDKKAA
tara:strand:- start:356 stop:514 length:159 start_codon:yes stop_codon:yes gene_type:complete